MKGARILLGVTGSIAAYKAADLTRRLLDGGAEVTVVMTEAAQRFVAPLTFETLSRRPVLTSLWDRKQFEEPLHITAAEWADLLLVAPASANFMGKLACGIADDLLSCLALAVKAPTLIAPAMNDAMFRHAAVQQNLRTLQKRGCAVVGPVRGRLATGKTAIGRLAETADILKAARTALRPRRKRKS